MCVFSFGLKMRQGLINRINHRSNALNVAVRPPVGKEPLGRGPQYCRGTARNHRLSSMHLTVKPSANKRTLFYSTTNQER